MYSDQIHRFLRIREVFEKVASKSKPQRAELRRLWNPIATAISFVTGAAAMYRYWIDYGKLTLPIIGLAAITLLVLSTVSVPAIRLFALRCTAFLCDLIVLACLVYLVFSIAWTLVGHKYDTGLFAVMAWFCVFYFIAGDWLVSRTPGKRLTKLALVSLRFNHVTIATASLRVILQLALVLGGSSLAARAAMAPAESSVSFHFGTTCGIALILLLPLSIATLGGNQSIVDVITGSVIIYDAERPNKSSFPALMFRMVSAAALSLAIGALLTSLPLLAYGGSPFTSKSNLPHVKDLTLYRNVIVPPTLWDVLSRGIKDPPILVRDINIIEVAPNPFSPSSADSYFSIPVSPHTALGSQSEIRIVRVLLNPEASTVAKLVMVQNFIAEVAPELRPNEPSKCIVLEFAVNNDYVLFNASSIEEIPLCTLRLDNRKYAAFAQRKKWRSLWVETSPDKFQWLLLGRLDMIDAETQSSWNFSRGSQHH